MFQKVREDDMLWDGNGVIPISAAQVVVPPVSRVEVSRLSEPEARCIEWKEASLGRQVLPVQGYYPNRCGMTGASTNQG